MAKKRKKIGGIFILILLFIIAVTVALTTPVFNITSVTVTGNETINEADIQRVAAIQKGTNIFRVRMRAAENRVESMPYILTAKIRRRFPAKVLITVTERQETFAVRLGEAGYAVTDETGRVLRLDTKAGALCILEDGTAKQAIEGQAVEMEDAYFLDKLQTVWDALKEQSLSDNIGNIKLDTADTVLTTRGEMEIHLGAMDGLTYKLQLVHNILYGGYEGIDKDSGGILTWTSEGQFSYRKRAI